MEKATIHFGYERFVSGVCREQFFKLIIYNNKRKLISDFWTEKSIREKEYPDKILERERKEGGFDRWIFHHLKLNMLMVWQM